MVGSMKRWKKEDFKEYFEGDSQQREWLDFCEKVVDSTINDMIRIVERLHEDHDRYFERVALKSAVNHLEQYEHNEVLDVPQD